MVIKDFINDQLVPVFDGLLLHSLLALKIVGALWIIQIVNALLGYQLNILGLYPRKIRGLLGIFLSPFLHGSFSHLFFNSIPLFILLNFLFAQQILCVLMTAKIIFLSGALLWLFGRRGNHVGASGIIMGYWSFLLASAYQHFSIQNMILSCLCLYYLGGLFLGIFPKEESVSWEGHLFGLLAGLVTALLW